MALVDVHSHIFLIDTAEHAGMIERMIQANVRDVILTALDLTTYEQARSFKRAHERAELRFHLACGLYPLTALQADKDAGLIPDADIAIDTMIAHLETHVHEICAIGEIGMDYAYAQSKEDRARDQAAFIAQLTIAERLRKPCIVHSRKAEREIVDLIEKHTAPIVLHSYTGSHKNAKRALERKNIYYSIPLIVHHSEHFQKLVEIVPLSRLLTETDSPYMPLRGERVSESAHIRTSIETIARIKGIEAQECENIIMMNAQRLFF